MANALPKMERFVGRVAVLTGSTQGIGLASARRLGFEGCKVVISSRRQQNVDEAVEKLREEGIEASGVVCDQGDKSHRARLLQHAVDKYGGFDCLFISAGANSHNGNLLTASEETYDHIFNMNLKSNFLLIQESIPHLVERGGGSVVTNATAAAYDAVQSVSHHLLLYALSKICLISMSQQLAPSCYGKKVRLNCVAPGAIQTPFLEGGRNTRMMQRYEALTGYTFGKDRGLRFGNPDEIASVVSFLLSDDASYINGQCIIACGGYPFTRSM